MLNLVVIDHTSITSLNFGVNKCYNSVSNIDKITAFDKFKWEKAHPGVKLLPDY